MSCAAALLEVLHSTPRLACLPGGRDRQGRPLLLVAAPEPANSSSVCNASSSSASFSSTHSTPPPSHGDVHELQATRDHVLEQLLRYLASTLSTETRRGGLAVLVDGQQASGRQVRASVRLVELTLRSDVAALLVLRPDAFWDKQRVDCTRSAHVEGQPLYIPLSRLHKYVDQGQLPAELGGSWIYDHARWVDNRLFVESFSRDAEGVVSDLEKVRHRLTALAPGVRASSVEPALALSRDMFSATTDVTSKVLAAGAEVLLQYETSYLASLPRGLKEHQLPQDLLDTKNKVSRTLEIVRGKQSLIAQAWGALEQGCRASRELGVLEAGVARVTDWLLGVAERLLDAQQAVGRDLRAAEQLRQQHETLELQCRETYGQYAELLHKIDTLPQQSNIEVPSDLKCQRDFMDFVCRSFASRLERRRNVLITSLRFYRLVSEYFERTSNLFELLGATAEDTESCEAPEAMMRSLDEDHASIEAVGLEARREGEKLMDVLSMPVKGALGREVSVSHEADILHVQALLDAAAARRHVFCGAVQLHRLRLQQTAHVRAYEEDATQAVQWLQDLYQVMLKEHAYVGCSVMEIQTQKDAHQTFQDTAKSTYEYGLQLVGAARALRQSSVQPPHEELSEQLETAWTRLQAAATEHMTRLRVSAVFHRSVEKHCRQLQELRDAVTTLARMQRRRSSGDVEDCRVRVRNLLTSREALLLEVGRMVRLGRLLRSRLREPLCPDLASGTESAGGSSEDEHMNAAAVEAISERLAEVTALAEALDAALGAARHEPAATSPSATSTHPPNDVADPELQSSPELLAASDEMASPATEEPTTQQQQEWYAHSGSSGDEAKTVETLVEDDEEEDEFVTVSECTCTPPSGASYHTAQSEPSWWRPDDAAASLVTDPASTRPASTASELDGYSDSEFPPPPPKSLDIATTEFRQEIQAYRETVEVMTTRLNVSHSEPLGLTSYLLTSETTRECMPPTPPDSDQGSSSTAEGTPPLIQQMKESRDWIQLKVLETTPALTQLGETLQDALELQRAHDEVLVQRQSKQSPVEDLLRQVDQRISTDDPKADVYAAMADSLGMAWRDVNKLLEERKALLDLNVQYHSAAQRSVDRMIALERASHDTSYPSDAETAKKLLTKLHDLKRAMLEAFMAALQEGRALLEKLQGMENIGTLDSRPGQTRAEAQRAISQVQHWLEALHDRRRALDSAWARRKAELEQALALAMLAAELASLDATLRVRHEALARSDQLGDSASSAELLLHEHNKLLPEAKDLQEKGLRVTRATDRLVSDENQPESAVSEPRKAQIAMQAYDVLSSCSEYLHLIDQRTDLLTQTIAFFRIAQAALTKLDQLEVQVATSEVPAAQIYAQVSRTLEEITTAPLQQGHALLAAADACGTHGTEGVRRVVEELENRKIALAERCAARKQESLLVTQALTAFLERYNELYSWLVGIGEAFVQGHQDMGSVLAMAQDFLELHKKLMHDLKLKISELESLEASLPSLVVHLQPDQRSDVEQKMANLRAQWERLRILLDYRLELSERYLRFHSLAVKLAAQYDAAEETMRLTPGGGRDSPSSRAPQEEQWLTCQQQLMQLNNVGENFLQDTAKETAASPSDRRDPHLDLKRARLCIETLLEHFKARQAALGDSWNLWQTRVTTFRETTVQWTRITMESTRTVEWVSRLDAQFYPLLDKNETSPRGLLNSLEEQQSRVLPEARRAQAEVELRLRSVEALQVQGEALAQRDHLVSQLLSLNQRFTHLVSEYQLLLQMLIAFFKNVTEIEKTTENLQNQYRGTVLPVEPIAVERMLKEHEASRHAVAELFRFTQTEAEQVAARIRQQEPPAAAQNDEDVIRRTLRDRQFTWERSWEDRKTQLEQHLQKCQFDADLHQLNQQLGDLATQLGRVKGQFGESLATSRANAQAFINFERTIELLERRVTIFVSTAEKLLADEHMNSSHVQQELERLQARWAALRSQVAESRRLIDLSVQYFTLVEEAEEWFREGSRLLVTIARKSTGVKSPEEATRLLVEVETFLKPGEARQNDRIAKISFLASQLYGEERSRQVTTVLTENHEMLESFSIINIELTTLARNLKAADEERMRQQREMLEADASLAAARAEAEAAKAAAAAAEEARKAAESAARALKESAIIVQQAPPPVQEISPSPPVVPVVEPQPPLKKVKHEEIAPILVVPVFVEALRDATIQEGDKFTFECRVAGFPRPEVEWFKDGISIQNNPDYQTSYINGVCQLQIEETFSEDSARFTCKAINDAGKAETHATLTVKEPGPQLTPPQVLKPLEDTEALEGSKHIFECTVHGYPLPTVQWFKDGTCIDASPDYTITFNNGECRLQLDEVFLEDQATFCCQASNRLGTCHTEAKLSVKPLVPSQAPAFTVPLTNIMARTGEKIKLECEVTGSPEPRITWTHDGKAVKETREVKIINEKLMSTLSISEAFPKDAGVYTAKAKNLVGGATSSCNVSVKGRLPTETSDSEMASDIEPVKPVIQMQLKDTRVEEGSPVKLDCIITGQPEPEVIWYHNGRPVKESKEVQLLFKGDRCTLVIKEALVEESGEYRVVAVNSAGEASSACQLIVDANEPTPEPEFIGVAPKFTKLLSDVLVPEGETTKFECVAEGDPVPTITWLLNNNPVPPSERLEMKHDENSGKVSLTITNTNTTDKGVYTAKASNSLGDAKCFATLIVRSHQETPELQRKEKQEAPYFTETLIDKTVIDGDTVRFECIVNGKPTPKVKWLYNDNPVSGREFLVSTSGQRQVLTMPDVSLDRSGIVACVAENEAGKAVCQASLRVQGVPPPSELMMDVDTTEEHTESFSMRRAVFMQSSSSTTIQGGPEGVERQSFTQQSQQAMQQFSNQPPTQMQSQRTEAVHQVNQERPVVHQQSSLVVSRASPVTVPPIKPALKQRKAVAPRFISPLNGRIVDQGSDVLLEGIVDGFPIPTVTWMKNGHEIPSSCETKFEHGKTTLQLHDVNVNDAGRYTCRAENEAGTASSTADLVVKKTVFPPVFGRRLQAQVVRIGDRARLEVEVTGTPEPEITWRKDNLPITCVPGVAVKAQGQCHSLVIEKATPVHTGQYSVSATNCGGQAQSIADFAVIEAVPGITLEVTRMVFEDVDEKKNGIASNLPLTKSEPSLPDTPVSKEISTTITEDSFSNTKHETSMKVEKFDSSTGQSVDLAKKTENDLKTEKNEDVNKLKDMSEFLARIKVEPPKEKIIPIELEKQSEELQKKKSEVLMDMQQKHIPKSLPQMENTTVKESKEIHSSSITTRIEKKYLSHNLNFDDIYLEPGPAPEICFSSLPEGTKLKENLAEKVKKFEEEMNAMIPMDAPAGAVRILPVRQDSVKINTDNQDTPLPDGISEYLIPTVQDTEKTKAVHFSEISATKNRTEEKKQVVQEVFVATSAPKTGSDLTVRPSTPQTSAPINIRTPNLQGHAIEKLWTPVRPTTPVERVASPKTVVIERSASPRISAEARAMEKLWTPLRPTSPIDLRPHSPKPKLEPPWIDRSASPRPNPEGIAMEKLWATKRSDHITTIITKEEPVEEPVAPAKPSIPAAEERAMSPKPSGQGIAMEKNWAHSLNPNLKKKWPPPNIKDSTVKPTLPWRKEDSFDEIQSETIPPQVDINANNTIELNETVSRTTVRRQVQSETTQQKIIQEIVSPVPVIQSIKAEQQEVKKSEAPVPPPKQESKIIAPPRPVAPKPAVAPEPPAKPQVSAAPPITKSPQPVAQNPTVPKKYYIAETEVTHKENPLIDSTVVTNDLRTEIETQSSFSSTTTKEEKLVERGPSPSVVEERGLKPSEAKKLWAQKSMEPPPPLKPIRQTPRKLEQFKPIVDNVPTVDRTLEILGFVPGPPPELGFVDATEPVVTERRQSKVSDIEVELEKEPKKHLVGAVRTIPPSPKSIPTVPKQSPATSAPKQITPNATQRPYTPLGLDKLLEPFPELEPFPFKPEPEKPKPNKLPPPPKPSRFVKGEFAESDYESDIDSVRIPVKWRPYESDTEEFSYRKVKPPALGSHSPRPKSTEPVPLPPTVFDNPPKFEGPPRPVLVDTIANQKQSSMSQQISSSRQTTTRSSTQVTRMTTVEQRSSSTTVTGSPPGVKHGEIIGKKSPPVHKKSESPKNTVTTISNKMIGELAAESGYMADTDEPRRHQKKIVAGMQDNKLSSPISHPATPISEAQKQSVSEKKQAAIVPPSHHKVHHHVSHKPHKKPIPTIPTTAAKPTACTTQVKEPPATKPVVEAGKIKPEDTPLEPFPYQPSPPSQPRIRLPPPPSPSKFKKGELRESDYESDYESQRIVPLWRPSIASDTEDTLQYRPVRPPSTPILIQRTSDSQSETPLPPTQFEEPPPLSEGPLRPKFEPIEKLTTHRFRIDTSQEIQNQVVKPMALLGNAVDGIKPGSPPKVSYVEPPHEGSFSQYHNGTDFRPDEISPPKVQQNIPSNQFPKATQMETSKKVHMSESTEYSRRFVTMEHTTRVIQFGEKDKIVETPLEPFPFKPDPEVPKTPVRVAPPPTPTKFIRGEFRESDYESDIDCVKIKPKWTPYDSDSEEPRYRKVQPPAVPSKHPSTPGRVPTPPTVFDTPPTAELEQQRLQRLDQMRRRFSEEKDGQPTVQAPVIPAKAAQVATQQMSEMTQAFKSKAQQFMTDITTNQKPAAVKPPPEAPALDGTDPSAYREESRHSEFGSKQIDPDTGLIYFKYDFGYEFGLILPGEGKPTTLKGGGKPVYDRDEDAIEFPIIHERSKPKRVKWESESELSEVEMVNQRPGRPVIPPIQRWEPSPSPTSSPSPSPWGAGRGQRPGQGRGGSQTPPSTPSTPGSTQSSQQFALSQLRKPPSFITPLRDIAATSGSTARFECIVQAEPPPNILWSKDGRIIENCPDRQMQYRNGVCRLTIPQAFPEDSGSYTCTATNTVGSACSTATLLVPGERRGRRP